MVHIQKWLFKFTQGESISFLLFLFLYCRFDFPFETEIHPKFTDWDLDLEILNRARVNLKSKTGHDIRLLSIEKKKNV